ncbi:hypothetical protein FDP22_06640 [Paroceanicella profunda]|uniref:Lipoprotein n=1 Tax=Paroceanicella profunda TaxID=2579971 RepID=A0A5B8FGW8_9RHOB|nr:hypothetical protein [Paroceanicella profunda]QDL91487.1 hypothetical protein FDP22_06640 [Paroceanicella profunda]
MRTFKHGLVFSTLLLAACAGGGAGRNQEVIAVGETKHLTVYIGDKCGAVPTFEEIEGRLPASQIISYSDGGVGERTSRRCGGTAPGRRILATGVQIGEETNVYEAGKLTVIVR